METDKDHIHILLEYDATERICGIVSIIKQRTTSLAFGYATEMYYLSNTGRNLSSGRTDTLLTVSAKSHLRPSISI